MSADAPTMAVLLGLPNPYRQEKYSRKRGDLARIKQKVPLFFTKPPRRYQFDANITVRRKRTVSAPPLDAAAAEAEEAPVITAAPEARLPWSSAVEAIRRFFGRGIFSSCCNVGSSEDEDDDEADL